MAKGKIKRGYYDLQVRSASNSLAKLNSLSDLKREKTVKVAAAKVNVKLVRSTCNEVIKREKLRVKQDKYRR